MNPLKNLPPMKEDEVDEPCELNFDNKPIEMSKQE